MHEDSREDLYFEMDFSEHKDVENGFDNSNKLYSYSDLDYKWETPNLDSSLKVDLDEIPRKRSNSIPIQLYSRKAYPTCDQKIRSTYAKNTILNSTSSSLAGTPTLSTSPSSSFISRKLRTSFSKLLKRSSFNRGKNIDQEQVYSDSDCYSSDDRRSSECILVSPSTEEVCLSYLLHGNQKSGGGEERNKKEFIEANGEHL